VTNDDYVYVFQAMFQIRKLKVTDLRTLYILKNQDVVQGSSIGRLFEMSKARPEYIKL
jgi:hypothetical protein